MLTYINVSQKHRIWFSHRYMYNFTYGCLEISFIISLFVHIINIKGLVDSILAAMQHAERYRASGGALVDK